MEVAILTEPECSVAVRPCIRRMEIVSHCYHYARLLRYHLSSFALWPPESLEIQVTICFAREDVETVAVLDWFSQVKVPRVTWNWMELPVLELCRRSIGRNRAALASRAEWVWFCDVDHWFTGECWRALAAMPSPDKKLIFPSHVNFHRWKGLGDARIQAADAHEGLISAPVEEFEPVRMRRAIGGIQIVKGDVCREGGYLRTHSRWQQPSAVPEFQRCKEDTSFRRSLRAPGLGLEIPGVYRIRHSKAGRWEPSLRL